MRDLCRPVVEFLRREDGPTAVEYAVLLALIVAMAFTAITALGSNSSSTFRSVQNSLNGPGAGNG